MKSIFKGILADTHKIGLVGDLSWVIGHRKMTPRGRPWRILVRRA
jgi:hypothetical protein